MILTPAFNFLCLNEAVKVADFVKDIQLDLVIFCTKEEFSFFADLKDFAEDEMGPVQQKLITL